MKQAEEDGSPVDLAQVSQERWTGANLDRPLLGQLRQAVKAGEVSVLYVYSPDRLSRNPLHLVRLFEEFASAGVEALCVGPLSTAPRAVVPTRLAPAFGYEHDKVGEVWRV